jgi:hypothetical protein
MASHSRRVGRQSVRFLGLVLLAPPSVALALAEAPSPSSPLRLEAKIELPGVCGRIDHMSVDPGKRRLFVAALGNDTVEVVDLAAARRVQTLRGLAEPQGVLVVPDLNRLVVANGRDGTVRIFDATSLAPLRSVPLGADADNLRLDPETGRAWAGYGSGGLRSIDVKEGTVSAEVPLGAHPESFPLEDHGTRAFVNVPEARVVAVVDRRQGRVLARWKTDGATSNFPMALDEPDKRLFVVCRTPPRLLVLDSDSGTVVAERLSVRASGIPTTSSTTRRPGGCTCRGARGPWSSTSSRTATATNRSRGWPRRRARARASSVPAATSPALQVMSAPIVPIWPKPRTPRRKDDSRSLEREREDTWPCPSHPERRRVAHLEREVLAEAHGAAQAAKHPGLVDVLDLRPVEADAPLILAQLWSLAALERQVERARAPVLRHAHAREERERGVVLHRPRLEPVEV